MTLTFDLSPWKPFQQCPLTWSIFMASFFEIPPSREISRHAQTFLDLAMTLTFDLWPWKRFQQFPFMWWISVPSVIQIPALGTEISRRAKYVLTDNGRTGRQTHKHTASDVDSSTSETTHHQPVLTADRRQFDKGRYWRAERIYLRGLNTKFINDRSGVTKVDVIDREFVTSAKKIREF